MINITRVAKFITSLQMHHYSLWKGSIKAIELKGLVHPKMKILSVFTHPHVVSTP